MNMISMEIKLPASAKEYIVVVPEAVYNELTNNDNYEEERREIEKCTFLSVEKVRNYRIGAYFKSRYRIGCRRKRITGFIWRDGSRAASYR